VHGQVRLGQQHDAGDAALLGARCGREAMEQFGHGAEARRCHGIDAERTQRGSVEHQW